LDSLNLLPVLGPVDHSSGNDNALFLAAARALDRTVAEPEAYRWSSATGQYHTIHAYSAKANNTLSKLCPYPVPPLYRLGVLAHRNVTTATVPDTSLPGHRPVLAGCRTYRRHGYFPPVEALSGRSDASGPDMHQSMDSYNRASVDSVDSDHQYVRDNAGSITSAPVVACLEPSRLPAIFGSHWNVELASPRAVYYEEKQLCGQLKLDCQHCLAACAEELKSSSLTCKPTANPADNGRSPRLEICFDCCARDNCSDVCDKYPAHRCHMQMCHYGLRLDFPLTPEWPKQGEFLCHVQPAPSRPVYRLHWSLLYQGRPLTPDRFPAALVLSTPNADGERRSTPEPQSGTERWNLGQGGQLNQVYRGLLNVQYTSGLEHLPDMIGGTDTMQSAYFWSKQTIPLVSGSATNTAFDPVASATSAAATGAIYANTMQSSSSHELSSVQVWPSQPLGVSTAAWARLSGAPCAAADPLLEQLNVYTPALPPYIAMGEAKVEYVGNYLYTVSHTKTKPKLTFSLPRSASLLGAVFSPASVERGQYLRASLALAWVSGATGMEGSNRADAHYTEMKSVETHGSFDTSGSSVSSDSLTGRMQRYWVIDLTGQVDQFPGLFRLRVYPDISSDADSTASEHAGSRFRQREFADATVEVEDEPGAGEVDPSDPLGVNEPDGEPLVEYDVGVFEERKFQLRILIPGPETEPDYEKAFRLIILDAKNRLDIRVKRSIQPPHEMALRRSYERLIDDGKCHGCVGPNPTTMSTLNFELVV
uniref:Guanylate cyclase domain-containing protein n=1 Tax=Echinostoma caproni TaxID=27848 RepID=A0A183ASE7_9TREM